MPELTTHQLNCAMLKPHPVSEPADPCSCGAETVSQHKASVENRARTLDDVSGEEWNKASADYRRKIASPRFAQPVYEVGNDSLPVVPPSDSEARPGISGEVRTTSATGGQKGVKLARYGLIPPEALALVAEHYGKGAEKYEVHNWRKGFEWSKSYDAMQRHLAAFWSGEDTDEETGSPHLAAVVFHALTLLTFATEHPDYDDRYKK